VVQPEKFEFSSSTGAYGKSALGFALPSSLLVRVDEVIDQRRPISANGHPADVPHRAEDVYLRVQSGRCRQLLAGMHSQRAIP
jgi:hypothetical protein